jgi:hypothetical protein
MSSRHARRRARRTCPLRCCPETGGILHQHQLFVELAESVFGSQLDLQVFTDRLALQRLFDQREDAVVTAMQIHQRMLAVVDDVPFRILDRIVKCDDRVFGDLHLHSLS